MEYIVWSRVRTFVYEYRDQFVALLFTIGVVVTSIIVVADMMAVTPTTSFESHEFPLVTQATTLIEPQAASALVTPTTPEIVLVKGTKLVNAAWQVIPGENAKDWRYFLSYTTRRMAEGEKPETYFVLSQEFGGGDNWNSKEFWIPFHAIIREESSK